jgi:hypothetical protein
LAGTLEINLGRPIAPGLRLFWSGEMRDIIKSMGREGYDGF